MVRDLTMALIHFYCSNFLGDRQFITPVMYCFDGSLLRSPG